MISNVRESGGEMRAAYNTTRGAILVAVALSCIANEAKAAQSFFYQGNDLYEWCGGRNKEYCVAYIMGTRDARLNDKTFCLPIDILAEDIVENVWMYLRDHPEIREKNAATLVEMALKQ